MRRRVRREAADRFGKLPVHSDALSATGLIPRDRYVDEPLQEVALFGRRGTPCIFELFVRGEVLAGTDQLDAGIKP
jgi:hypothetical protein